MKSYGNGIWFCLWIKFSLHLMRHWSNTIYANKIKPLFFLGLTKTESTPSKIEVCDNRLGICGSGHARDCEKKCTRPSMFLAFELVSKLWKYRTLLLAWNLEGLHLFKINKVRPIWIRIAHFLPATRRVKLTWIIKISSPTSLQLHLRLDLTQRQVLG